jgi:hypothetical protein
MNPIVRISEDLGENAIRKFIHIAKETKRGIVVFYKHDEYGKLSFENG